MNRVPEDTYLCIVETALFSVVMDTFSFSDEEDLVLEEVGLVSPGIVVKTPFPAASALSI